MDVMQIRDLKVEIETEEGTVQAVRGVSLDLHAGEILALFGESGCGKSTLCRSVLRLLPPHAKIVSGSVELEGEDLLSRSEKEMLQIRRKRISMVLQDPGAALDPLTPIGKLLIEAIRLRDPAIRKRNARKEAVELLAMTGIDHPETRMKQRSYELSGGMQQRVVLAIALCSHPDLLIADEPTSALDASVSLEVLRLLEGLKKTYQMSILLVSHEIEACAAVADRMAVMYAGRICECGRTDEILHDARHPYTKALLRSLPSLNEAGKKLQTIAGQPPRLIDPPAGDLFAYRNPDALQIDYEMDPPRTDLSETHYVYDWKTWKEKEDASA